MTIKEGRGFRDDTHAEDNHIVINESMAKLIGPYARPGNIIHQEKLAGIQSSIIRTLRISWIQLPFGSTFFVSNDLIRKGGPVFWAVEIPLVLAFTVAAVILFRNLTPEKMERRKWVRKLVQGTGWKSITRAMGFMQEITAFRRENGGALPTEEI